MTKAEARTRSAIRQLSTRKLHEGARAVASEERGLIVGLLFYLEEIDKRGAYDGCTDLWDYCKKRLLLPDHQIFLRTAAVRLMRRFPEILPRLRDGRLNLSTLCALRKVLTEKNAKTLLEAVEGKTKKEAVQIAVASKAPIRPRASITDVPLRVVEVPSEVADLRKNSRSDAAPPEDTATQQRAFLVFAEEPLHEVEAVSSTQCEVKFTAPISFKADIEELKVAYSHLIPDGDLAAVMMRAVHNDLARLRLEGRIPERSPSEPDEAPASEATTTADPTAPGASTAESTPPAPARGLDVAFDSTVGDPLDGFRTPVKRPHIPRWLRRLVMKRDKGCCQYKVGNGICGSRFQCEIDHIEPVALGGKTEAKNLRVVCSKHNKMAAEEALGKAFIAKKIEAAKERARSGVVEAEADLFRNKSPDISPPASGDPSTAGGGLAGAPDSRPP